VDRELQFLAGRFLREDSLPKNKRYLYKYFTTEPVRALVRYFLLFGESTRRFTQHTGHVSSRRWMRIIKFRIKKLEAMREQARADKDTALLAQIESGKLKIKDL
jgi:hypothetical protein